jgi:hypothetical protein
MAAWMAATTWGWTGMGRSYGLVGLAGRRRIFTRRGRARMTTAGVTRITAVVSRVRTAEAEQGVWTPTIRTYRVVEIKHCAKAQACTQFKCGGHAIMAAKA